MGEPYGFWASSGPDGYPGDAVISAANEAEDLRAENERLREAVDGLTANVKRWRNRASAERLKRQRWRKRALAAEAEVKRLWKIEIDALWLARLACSSSWPMEMAQQVENAAERVRAAFSDGKEGDRG